MLCQHHDIYQPDLVGTFNGNVPSYWFVSIQHDYARVTPAAKALASHPVLGFEQRLAEALWPGPGCQLFGKRLDEQCAHKGLVVCRLKTVSKAHETVTVSSQWGSSPRSCCLKSAVSLNVIIADTPSRPASGWVGCLRRTTTSLIGIAGLSLHSRARGRADRKSTRLHCR